MMDLDEAIQSLVDEMEKQAALGHSEHIDNLEQLAEWLKELKAYKEKETCETCGHYKAYQHGADITTMDDECGGCCSWNSKWIPNTCGDAISRQAVLDAMYALCGTGETLKENPWRDNPHIDAITDAIDDLPSVTPQQRTGRCKDCKYFEYDSVAKVDGIPLIVAHEICSKWGDGCKTKEDGYCFLFEPQESEDKE